jgi:hypothetical protein
LGEITLDLRLVIKIPSSTLTINGLVLGMKQSAPQNHATILSTLLEALEEKVVERICRLDSVFRDLLSESQENMCRLYHIYLSA